MKAARWFGAQDVRIEAVPEPEITDPSDVLVEVDLATICASDLAEWRDGPHTIPTQRPHKLTRQRAPVTLGHEYVGRVLAVGRDVRSVRVGDRVCGDACLRCGRCYWCLRGEYNICVMGGAIGFHRDGAFAARLTVPDYSLYRVPDGVHDSHAAVVEPMAVALHALRRGRFEAGDAVVILGLGMVGASTLMLANALGAKSVSVVEPAPSRANLAARLGAGSVFNPAEPRLQATLRSMTSGVGADVVVDCTGNAQVLAAAVGFARRGGRVVVCGIPHTSSTMNAEHLVYFEREIVGSLGYCYDHETILALLEGRRLDPDPLLAAPVSLDEIVPLGLQRMAEDPDVPLRIPVAIRRANA